jgi:hypothetical protein
MPIRRQHLFILAACLAVSAYGQVSTRRASMRGGGGNYGKCTIEVEVDDIAEIEISGDMGRLRTIGGQPARWRRFECNQVMPSQPYDFRFSGVDGRGRQQLLRDPSRNRGVAVIRIDDSKGGSQGYTFDIEWRGSGGGGSYEGPRGRDRERERGGDRIFIVSCSSGDMRRHYCEADTRGGVRLLRQQSEAACRRDYSWGFDRRGIWVDHGCRAEFEVAR